MGRRRRRSSRTLVVALGLGAAATFALLLDCVDPGPHRAIITVCLAVVAAQVFQAWHTARAIEIADENRLANKQVRRQHAEKLLRGLVTNAERNH